MPLSKRHIFQKIRCNQYCHSYGFVTSNLVFEGGTGGAPLSKLYVTQTKPFKFKSIADNIVRIRFRELPNFMVERNISFNGKNVVLTAIQKTKPT